MLMMSSLVLSAVIRVPYISTVTHNGYTVCDDLDLVHTVRDVNNTQILLTKVADNVEQICDLLFCQRCRRLVKDNDLCFVRNCFCDLAHLLFSDSQVVHFSLGSMSMFRSLNSFFDSSIIFCHQCGSLFSAHVR